MRKLRFLFPVLGLVLVLAAVLTLCPRPAAASFEEYYARLFPRQRNVMGIVEYLTFDYPRLRDRARTILVVRAEDELTAGAGTGYSRGDKYSERDLRRYWDPRTPRQVKVLRVIKGENTKAGDSVWVLETGVLTEEGLLARKETWPMVKGCVYLLFLDGDPAACPEDADARPVCWINGWFDLTHLSLNDPHYLHILTAALADNDLLSQRRAAATGTGTEGGGKAQLLSTPWTARGYTLSLREAPGEGAA